MNERKEFPQNLDYEVVQPITQESLAGISALIERENQAKSELMQNPQANRDTVRQRMSYTNLLNQSMLNLKEIEEKGSVNNFVVLAKDGTNVAGFSIVGIDDNKKVISSFTGLGWDYQKKGIATELARKGLAKFREMGITEISADMWQGSLAIAERLQEEENLEIIDQGNARYLIKLRQQ